MLHSNWPIHQIEFIWLVEIQPGVHKTILPVSMWMWYKVRNETNIEAFLILDHEKSLKQTIYHCHCQNKALKVLWRLGVILWLCSQYSQAEWVRYTVGPHHMSVTTRGRGLDLVCSISAIQALGAEKATSTSPSAQCYSGNKQLHKQ